MRGRVGGLGDILELISVSIYLKFAGIVMALQGNNVSEGANSAIHVFPRRRRDTRNAVLRSNLGLVDGLLAQVSGILIPLEGVGGDGGDVNVAPKVSRQVAEVGALLDDRPVTVRESQHVISLEKS